MKIGIFGSGYVGLVTAACFAQSGNYVICRDVNQKRVESLNNGQVPIYEPGLKELIESNISAGRLRFTLSAEEVTEPSEFLFIAVGTPEDEEGRADLKYVRIVANEIGKFANGPKVVINKSTVPVGTGEMVKETIDAELNKRKVEFKLSVASNPEFLREGSAIQDFMNPDRVIVGSGDKEIQKKFTELYLPFAKDERKILFMNLLDAELTKYAANAFLATKISFMNEISNLCERVGGNIENIRRGIGSDNRIGTPFLNAGIGYGGSCFPKDVMALIKTFNDFGLEHEIIESVHSVNKKQRQKFLKKIESYFTDKAQKLEKVVVWGISFKPGTDDMREAPSKDIIEKLLANGVKVSAFDPEAKKEPMELWGSNENFKLSLDQYCDLDGADALLILTEWPEFRQPDFEVLKNKLKNPLIFDGRNTFPLKFISGRGFEYHSVGRPMISA